MIVKIEASTLDLWLDKALGFIQVAQIYFIDPRPQGQYIFRIWWFG